MSFMQGAERLKIKFVALMLLSLTLLVATVYAPWSSLSSGYAIWTNYHGIDIPSMTAVTATAGTIEYPGSSAHSKFPDVTHVRFVWMVPDGSNITSPPCTDPPKPLTWDGSLRYPLGDPSGWPVYTADDTQILDVLGDWGVQAWFYDKNGGLVCKSDVEKKRAVSVNVVPEIPIVGTAGAVALMLLAAGLYLQKKKKYPIKNPFLTA
jgi:hypothetical protein